MKLTPEERQLGRDNFYRSLGVTRRDLLKAAAVAPAVGAFYFGYSKLDGNPVRAGLIGSGDQGNVLLTESNPDYLQFIAYSDIRPSQKDRAKHGDPESPYRLGFMRKYEINEEQFNQQISFYEDYQQLLENPEIELVVIALPLHLHYEVVMAALEAGKHVLCEMLMAEDVGRCKEMARKARETGLYLAVGHQRHYSILYDNAFSLGGGNLLGEIQHIRARWHRNDSWPRMENGTPVKVNGKIQLENSWRQPILPADEALDVAKYGYKSIEELCWWRHYRRTAGSMMAELGSQQLDACSMFLGQQQPLAVSAVGGKFFYEDDRDTEDHVFATFEFPGDNHPRGKNAGNQDQDIAVVTYSAISTNAIEEYGEQIMGSRGTLLVESEREVLLFMESDSDKNILARETQVTVSNNGMETPVLETTETSGVGTASAGRAQAILAERPSRGYREQMEHLAWCIRNPAPENQPRCGPQIALSRAVCALTADLAMREQRRIEFRPEWFDVDSEETPATA